MTTPITNFSSLVAQVRLLIADIDLSNPILNDSAVEAFLVLNDDNVRRAAAQALMAIAVNETLVQKRIRLLDLSTDGPGEAQVLMDLAKQYRLEADQAVVLGEGHIMYLAAPDVARFDRRSQADWDSLHGER